MKPDLLSLGPNRVWRTYPGGKVLDRLEGRETPKDDHFPEDWMASTTRAVNIGRENIVEGLSKVLVDGKEHLVKDLFEQDPEHFLGKAHVAKFGKTSFFLLKYLDSAIRLHIQAHPTIPFAQKYLNSNSGKTEGYYILATRPEVAEPAIYFGFKKVPERATLKQLVEKQDIDGMLAYIHKIIIKPGDSFIIPGGCPHAIGDGVFMIEIMEPTDFAIRLEFERGGYVLPEASRFMNRGIDFALDMLEFQAYTEDELKKKFFAYPKEIPSGTDGVSIESVIDERHTTCFSVKRYRIAKPFTIKENSFFKVIVTDGQGSISAGKTTVSAEQWNRFFVPHASGALTVNPVKPMELIVVLPPKP